MSFTYEQAREHYHVELMKLFEKIVKDEASEEDLEGFRFIAGIYHQLMTERNLENNLAQAELVRHHFERQTVALERIAEALSARP